MVTKNWFSIGLFDGILEGIVPTADFVPVTGHPLSALTEPTLYESTTRTPGLTDARLEWDAGTPVEANVFMLAGSNASLDAEGYLEAADNAGFTMGVVQSSPGMQPLFDTSLGQSRGTYTPPWKRLITVVLPQSYTKRYWAWNQSDPANPQGYHQWSIAGLGLLSQFEISNWQKEPHIVGTGGLQTALRQHDVQFPNMSQSDAYTMESISLLAGTLRRMLVIPEPLSPATFLHDNLWCTLKDAWRREANDSSMSGSGKLFRGSMKFIEVGV